ncbi:hypothetical protein [Cellulomonas sp. P24]|uniref:hypothetical protein n=1 Tax=Cellulomonas sp. P24 TaxID=2885206 RepID=UPI00216B0826|nr:hypothetical protein [Cellulomonas sp. P24]MCR6494213.1 hypothetical protein [Cellulomonas sp. P24]
MSSAESGQHDAESIAEEGPRILLYSDHVDTREQVLLAVGRRLGKGQPPIRWVEVATEAAVISAMDEGLFDLLVLDGETGKVGGMGLCRQLKDEIFECPPVLVLTGRPQDAWLASWSYADAVVSRPLDPIEVQRAVADLLRAPADAV